jgi:hypothetical protein
MWTEYDAPEHLTNSSYWPSVPLHEPVLEETYRSNSHQEHPEVQEHSHDYTATSPPSRHQDEAPEQAHSERRRPSTPFKCAAEGRAMLSKNHACRVEPPSKKEKEEADETARNILGSRIINLATVQVILKLQATRVDPWNG